MNHLESLGNLIQKKREEIRPKMSLRELARQVGITPSYLSEIENKGKIPSDKVGERIAKILSIPYEVFKTFLMFKAVEKTFAPSGSTVSIVKTSITSPKTGGFRVTLELIPSTMSQKDLEAARRDKNRQKK
jgi:transcriptional regulator with XRE-family HTH domain